jgi:hypothetical protein
MNRVLLHRVALLAATSALGLAACSSEPAAKLVGSKVDNYMLVDQNGMGHILKYDTHTPAVVLVSHVNGDEGSRAAAKAAQALAEKNAGVVVQLINSSPVDTRETIAAEAKEQGLTVPVLDDEFQLIGASLGVTKAGEAFVIEPKTWTVIYHGDVAGAEAAVAEIAAGKPVTKAEVAVKGTAIAFADRSKEAQAGFQKISYSKEVAPILMKRCVDCHQQGGIAPWQMSNYEIVKGFAPMIREAIRTDRMPPYDVDRHYGAFDRDENLTEAETKTLIHWIEAGAPSDITAENADPLIKGVVGRPDWPLGPPDLVVDIPAYNVPAAGIVDYQLPVVANPMKEGRWLKATTFKAGNRQGVHHILAGWLPQMPKGGRGFDWKVSMGGYAVGSESNFAPDKWATWIPAGGAISFQMHYTPIGKEFTDNSKIGFYWSKEDPELVKRQIIIADPSIEIAPNQARWHETAYVQFPAAVQVYAAQIHAHYRGYASKLTAIYPDGKEQILINMPHYDFNWQREYIFKDLIDLPAGTKLVADYWYDNSVNNKALELVNAKDLTNPSKTVPWGDQSFDEMLFTGVQFRWVDETAKNPREDLQKQLEDAQLITVADDNRDGQLQESELKSSMFKDFKDGFAQIDADKSGALSGQELGAAMQEMAKRQQAGRAAEARGERTRNSN